MKYLIVGDRYEADAKNYSGTYRKRVTYSEKFNDEHPVNRMFFAYLKSKDKYDLMDNLELAKEIAEIQRKFTGIEYQVIQVEVVNEYMKINNENKFLGYDISSGVYLSYLHGGLNICESEVGKMYPIMCLLERYFKPTLNQNGLFDEYKIAKFFLECIKNVNILQANFWDDPSEYEIIYLSKV